MAGGHYFYRAVWRWHFYAGLFVVPFMLMLAITGIIYLFKPQLDAWMYRDLLFVTPGPVALAAESQLDTARGSHAGATPLSLTAGAAADRSTQVNLVLADGREMAVFVDPYIGRVLGERNERRNLQYYALKLHGELLLGTVGDWIVELAACWALVLLVTGVYLWWPRDGLRLWGVWLPRLSRHSSRIFWRDLHSVTGIYSSVLVAFLLITGLPWAIFWGTSFAQVWNRYPPYMYNGAPQSGIRTGRLNEGVGKVVPWAAEQLPMPESMPASSSVHHNHDAASGHAEDSAVAPHVNLDEVLTIARHAGAPAGFTVTLPPDAKGVYTVSAVVDDPRDETVIHIDQYSGAILADARWRDYGLVAKAVSMGIDIHEGKFFGLANQLVMLLGCLAVIVMSVSGTVMWWRRRPEGRLGAPAIGVPLRLWKGAVAIAILMGLLLPLMGLSLLVVLTLDYAVIARIPGLRATVG
ncbi:MAG: PepSY domain-containing protein [Acidobacteriota bacterium]